MKKLIETELRMLDAGLSIPLGNLTLEIGFLKPVTDTGYSKFYGIICYQTSTKGKKPQNDLFYIGYWPNYGFYSFFNTDFSLVSPE